MQFEKLISLIECLDEEGKELFEDAIASFFVESLISDYSPFEEYDVDLITLQEKLGEDICGFLFLCAVEFFLSNEYPNDSYSWNAVDFILKKTESFLPPEETLYLKGLRDSYMSLYTVIDVKKNHSIILRNLLEKDQAPIIIHEEQGTDFIYEGDVLGARIVHFGGENLFAEGLLMISGEASSEVQEVIDQLSNIMMSKENISFFKEETKDPFLMIKKMWVKEIAAAWVEEKVQERQESFLFNYDQDKRQA